MNNGMLTPREFDLLVCLMHWAGQVATPWAKTSRRKSISEHYSQS